jgi:hypothetical protein
MKKISFKFFKKLRSRECKRLSTCHAHKHAVQWEDYSKEQEQCD